MNRTLRSLFAMPLLAFALLASLSAEAHAITLSWSPIGDPDNTADIGTGLGAVSYSYSINTFDVTVGQYTAFLNAVAATDTYGLYTPDMAHYFPSGYGASLGIVQNNTSGNYTYTPLGNPNVPVFDVSWGSAARFANWLQNGQPTNLGEAAGSTETGAYTLNGTTDATGLLGIGRNSTAIYAIPNANEWYKAAYYKGGGTHAGYWPYATQNNSLPSNVLSATGTNNANFENPGPTDVSMPLSPVGYFAGSPGPYGTFDMNGDVFEWTEEIVSSNRGIRGGSWGSTGAALPSSFLGSEPANLDLPTDGFRLVMLAVPEPGSISLLLLGAGGLMIWRRHRRSQRPA